MTIEIKRVDQAASILFSKVAPEVFDEPIHQDRLAEYLSDPSHVMVLAVTEEEVIGQAAAVIHKHPDKPDELYIDEVGVTPRFQRQGVGKLLMDEMLAWGRELGCASAWLATEVDNEAARALYEKFANAEPIVMFQWKL